MAPRTFRVLSVSAFLAYAAACLFVWASRNWTPEWDGAVYVLVAKSLAAGEGYLYQGEPFFLRPPALPWLLSFWVGGPGFEPYPVNLVLMGCAALAAVAVFWAVRSVESAPLALAVALLSGTSLLLGQLFNSIFAEFPFMVCAFAAIALLERARRAESADDPPSPVFSGAHLAAAGLLLAGAVLFRTVAVLLLPGVVLLPLLLPRRGAGRASRWAGLLPLAIAVALTLPWFRYSSATAAVAELPVEQDLLYDYSTALFHVDPGDPSSARVSLAGWIERIRSNGRALASDLTKHTLHFDGGWFVEVVFGLVLVAGVVRCVRRRGLSMLEWLAAVYVPLIATYFVYDKRLDVPLVPLVYLYLASAFQGALGLLRGAGEARRGPISAAVAALLLVANVTLLTRDLAQRGDAGRNRSDMARGVVQHTPPDARLLCNQAPTMALLTGRQTFTYRFRRSADPLTKYGIDFVLYDTPNTPAALKEMVEQRAVGAWSIPFGEGLQTRLIRVR